MLQERTRVYDQTEKDQILKECFETKNYGAVASMHGVPATTIYGWIKKYRDKDKSKKSKEMRGMAKEVADLKLENQILKELLKKSHQLWLKE